MKINRSVFYTLFMVISISLLTSCEQIIDNVTDDLIPEPESLMVGLRNNTPYNWKRAEIRSGNVIQIYDNTKKGTYSAYKLFNSIHSEAVILIQTEQEVFRYTPKFYDESTEVTEGTYYFEVSLVDLKTLVIKRKSF
ncbi:hypothetical protein ACJOV8_005115 [Formosa sp. 3Alg 14/1]|uniref:hypothetical protein n=1 Tax=Formosa sp. 3Alg 14/1 TaxID=3382190 RepID=UPI0039BDCDC9